MTAPSDTTSRPGLFEGPQGGPARVVDSLEGFQHLHARRAGDSIELTWAWSPSSPVTLAAVQWDCAGERPEMLRLSARVNPHSPHQYRINGVVVNMPQYAEAFHCKAGQPMVKEPDKVCRIW